MPHVREFAFVWFNLQAAKRRHNKRCDQSMTLEEERRTKEALMVCCCFCGEKFGTKDCPRKKIKCGKNWKNFLGTIKFMENINYVSNVIKHFPK